MKKIIQTIGLIVFCVTITKNGSSQSRQDKDYNNRAQEVEQEVLNAPDPMFSVTGVPASYSKSSAVIIAKKVEIFSDLKSKMKWSLFFGKETTNMIRYSMTIRERIKIQDKNALNEYAEISFSKIRSQSSFFKHKSFSFIGIRLIKSDGSIKKIDIDEEAVNAESEEEKDKYKLALPGLELGDIIDMYTRIEKESNSDITIDPLDIVLAGDYPVVKYSFSTKVRNEFGIIYTTANGVPEVKETRDDDFIYLNFEMNDILQSTNKLWSYDRRELPVFKINIVPGVSGKGRANVAAPEKGQVLKAMPGKWVETSMRERVRDLISASSQINDKLDLLDNYLDKIKKEKKIKTLSKDSLISYIYYYGRFAFLYDYMSESKIEVGLGRNSVSTNYYFYAYLISAFKEYDITFDLIYTVPRDEGTIKTVTATNELILFLRANGEKTWYLVPPNVYTIANSFPSIFEGQDAYVFKNSTGWIKDFQNWESERLPATNSSFNYSGEELEVSVDPVKPQQLEIQRIRTIRGNGSYESQALISLFQEYIDQERAKLKERSFEQEILARMGKRRGQELVAEYAVAYTDARKKRMEYVKSELEESFDTKSVTLDSVKVLQIGNRHDQRDFKFYEKISIDGWLKKAGNNYIVDIGKLLGGQTQVKAEQRERKSDVYMSNARSFGYKITFNIPDNYTVEGLENLNKNISNETGSFVSTAIVENGKLLVNVLKTYHHNFESKENWPKLLEFVDAAYQFTTEKILLKKK